VALSKNTGIALIVAALALGATLTAQLRTEGRRQLDRSIAVLMTDQLQTDFSISRSKLEAHEVDLGGLWWVRVDQSTAPLIERLTKAGFTEADDSDSSYYKRTMLAAFGPGLDLSPYRVFRAESALGKGTICETLPCNLDVVVDAQGRSAFVAISKT
jgi:hypothetical protein